MPYFPLQYNRRQFIRCGIASAGGLLLASTPARAEVDASAPDRSSAGDRTGIAVIGLGMEGAGKNLSELLRQPDAQVVALCDVNATRLAEARARTEVHYAEQQKSGSFKGVLASTDWREIVGLPEVDAVVVATPDHWHALISLHALVAGKDVLCEKPLSLTIHEGRLLSDTARRLGRVMVTASEARMTFSFHFARELVRNGCIGTLQNIRVRAYRGFGQEETTAIVPLRSESPPSELDYEMWLGPAPDAPYQAERVAYSFRYMYDYAGGNLADWGGHVLDAALWGAGLSHTGPELVTGSGTFLTEGIFDTAVDWSLRYTFVNGLTLHYESGGLGVRFEGSDGYVEADFNRVDSSIPEVAAGLICPGGTVEPMEPMTEIRNFLDCIRTRRTPLDAVEDGHRAASLAHLGNIVLRLNRSVAWDPQAEIILDDPVANSMCRRALRAPWKYPV